MHRIKTALAGGVATVAAALLLGCATVPAPVPDAAAKKELAPTGILRVAVFTGNPVIGTSDKKTGEVKGTTEILGRELARQAGVRVHMIAYTSMTKLVDDARGASWDVVVLPYDPARLNVIDFVPPHLSVGPAEGVPAAEMCFALPKGRAAALAYVGVSMRHARESGKVAEAIERAGLRGVSVAKMTDR